MSERVPVTELLPCAVCGNATQDMCDPRACTADRRGYTEHTIPEVEPNLSGARSDCTTFAIMLTGY